MGVQLGSGHVNLTKWRGAFLAGRASAQNKAHQIESKRVLDLSLFLHSRSQVDSADAVRKLFTIHSIIN
jgi:hypothetical protein